MVWPMCRSSVAFKKDGLVYAVVVTWHCKSYVTGPSILYPSVKKPTANGPELAEGCNSCQV